MKNNLFFGIFFGALAPIVAFLLSTYTNLLDTYFSQKPFVFYAIAVLINLIVMRFLFRGQKESTAKGILITTFVAMLVYLFKQRLSL